MSKNDMNNMKKVYYNNVDNIPNSTTFLSENEDLTSTRVENNVMKSISVINDMKNMKKDEEDAIIFST